MRISTGGFYEIDGGALRAVWAEPAGPAAAAGWKSRQADLWSESSTLIHVNHRMSDDELGLWGAMQRELERIRRTLDRLDDIDRAASVSPTGPGELAVVEPKVTVTSADREGKSMYRLVTTVRRGSASNLPGAWLGYATIEDARLAAAALLREECVQRVMIVLDALPMTFVEWQSR
jgi:hypothetical protein